MQKMMMKNKYYITDDFTASVELWLYKYSETDTYFELKVCEEIPYIKQNDDKHFKTKESKYYKSMSTAFSIWSLVTEYYNLLKENSGKMSKGVKRAKVKARVFSNLNSVTKENMR